jgi:S-adenosylmethionine:tRNA ribosyltransferase-isomerase
MPLAAARSHDLETSVAPGDAVDDDNRRFAANRAGCVFGSGFHAGSIRHQPRDGKVRRDPAARHLHLAAPPRMKRHMALRTKDFDYHLPDGLIAARPLPERAASRMLVVHRGSGRIEHRMFREFPEYLKPEDLLVLNDTKVIPARVFSDDGSIELLCLDRLSPQEWRCLVKPGKRMKPRSTLTVAGITGTVMEVFENGDRLIHWERELDLNAHGHLALPHYMGRDDETADRERYQTVFAREEGAIAAPTAGLHFTPEMLEELPHAFLTLHVGVGTFRPVKAEVVSEHLMHSEKFAVSAETARKVNAASRVVAVGTTVTRVLEAIAGNGKRIEEKDHVGETDIFIHPPHDFRVVGALLTNFHLPQSTLIMLVSAFAGRELVMEAYRQAVAQEYRFYSYGDCMLLI